MKEIVFLLEEPSAEEMLKGLLPKITPEHVQVQVNFIIFQGKTDLEKRLERKIRHYQNPDACFIVMRDQDSGNCENIKHDLVEKCKRTQKRFLVRIVCHELENWYIADLLAVERAFCLQGISRRQNAAKYRDPDRLTNAKQELRKLVPQYQPISGSREIGKHLDPENTRSKSFSVFVESYKKIVMKKVGSKSN
jgi:hypothetical protein